MLLQVGDLFTAIEGRQVRVKRKASPAGTAHSSPSPRPRSGSGAKRPSPVVLQSGTFSSKTPRADTARTPLHQPRAMVATFPKPQVGGRAITHCRASQRPPCLNVLSTGLIYLLLLLHYDRRKAPLSAPRMLRAAAEEAPAPASCCRSRQSKKRFVNRQKTELSATFYLMKGAAGLESSGSSYDR